MHTQTADAVVYLDNASTTFPKPDCVWESARSFLTEIGVSPGRSGHRRARLADEIVEHTRELLAALFRINRPSHIAFTSNATAALNICIKGFLATGDHVVTTAVEHNSVLRPLEALRRNGMIQYAPFAPRTDGEFDLDAFEEAVSSRPRLVILNHASNVTGAVTPVREMTSVAHRYGAKVLVDVSQTAGVVDVDVEGWQLDMIAFTGHKCLLGPSGIGGLYIRDPASVQTTTEGGTGISSQSLRHPAMMPAKFEAGTPNYLGVAGLNAALQHRAKLPVSDSYLSLAKRTVASLRAIEGTHVYAPADALHRVPIISFNVDGLFASELAAVLDTHFGVLTRAGLHCAPLIHEVLGTAPHGTVRASLGPYTTPADISRLTEAVSIISSDAGRYMR